MKSVRGTRDYYDSISSSYCSLYASEQRAKWGFIKSRLDVGGRVLDLGCGPGFLSQELEGWVGLDLSENLLRQGRGVRVLGDAHRLPFGDGVFDWVVCLTVLQDVPNPELVVGEARRVSRNQVFSVLKREWSKRRAESLGYRVLDEGVDWVLY